MVLYFETDCIQDNNRDEEIRWASPSSMIFVRAVPFGKPSIEFQKLVFVEMRTIKFSKMKFNQIQGQPIQTVSKLSIQSQSNVFCAQKNTIIHQFCSMNFEVDLQG